MRRLIGVAEAGGELGPWTWELVMDGGACRAVSGALCGQQVVLYSSCSPVPERAAAVLHRTALSRGASGTGHGLEP
jgi:hypothetical protein